jgi:hypothetical protein
MTSRGKKHSKNVSSDNTCETAGGDKRNYFLNTERSRFNSVGYYPDKNYGPHVEVGGVKCAVILSPYFFTSLLNHLPKLVENFSNKQQYRCVKETFQS